MRLRKKPDEQETITLERDRIARRLQAISNAKPVICPKPVPKKKSSLPERAPRQSVFRLASLYTSKNAAIRCVVYNVSATGVRITMEGAHTLPKIVVLKFDCNKESKKCQPIWQKGEEAGLKFIDIKTNEATASEEVEETCSAQPISRRE